MADRLILHIGPRKTGTTYLQRVLQQLAPTLERSGILYPTRYRDGEDYNHVGAVTDLTHNEEARDSNRWTGRDGSDWQGLADQVAAWDGTVIISAEMLGGLRPPAAQRVIDGLPHSSIDIVVTMRDLGRIFPSSWQQHIRNTHTQDYRSYIKRRVEERGTLPPAEMQSAWDTERHQTFWRSYAYGALVRRWQALVGSDRVTVVTLPPAGSPSHLLWDRFRAAMALPELPEQAPKLPAFIANMGSTQAEAMLLHAMNVEAKRRGWNRKTVNELQQQLLASGFLERPDRDRPLMLPSQYLEVTQEWARVDVADLGTTGATVHGDVADLLVPDTASVKGRVDARVVAAAGAYATIHAMVQQAETLRRQQRREAAVTLPGRLFRRAKEKLRPSS